MKKQFTFLPYAGESGFAFVGCSAADEPIAAKIVDKLASRGFCLSCYASEKNATESTAELAEAIEKCKCAVVFLSEKSMEQLFFRNQINYLMSLKKPIVLVKIGEFRLTHGLEMQLANVQSLPYTTVQQTADALVESGVLTQEMVGKDMVKRVFHQTRNWIILAMVVVCVAVFLTVAAKMVQTRTSAAYRLRDVDGSAYCNIAAFGDEGIAALAGKSVTELDLSGGKCTSLSGIEAVSAETVNVSGISAQIALWPLTQVQGIQKVIIDQNQCIFAKELCEAGITVVVAK